MPKPTLTIAWRPTPTGAQAETLGYTLTATATGWRVKPAAGRGLTGEAAGLPAAQAAAVQALLADLRPGPRGRALEGDLEAVHARYLAQGLAAVERVPSPPRSGADARAKGVPDFLGCLDGGQCVALEAKEFRECATLNKLADEQLGALLGLARRGAVALLVVQVDAVRWVLPAAAVEGMRAQATTWRAAGLDEVGARIVGADWLAAVKAQPARFGVQA